MGLQKTRSTKAANRQEESLEEGIGAPWSTTFWERRHLCRHGFFERRGYVFPVGAPSVRRRVNPIGVSSEEIGP